MKVPYFDLKAQTRAIRADLDLAIAAQRPGPPKKPAEREPAVAALALIDQRLADDAAEAQAALDDLSELDLFPIQEPTA